MPISPKIKLGNNSKEIYIANKEFTDRKIYKEIFLKEIEKIKKEKESNKQQYHVINFYGIGGIGKSSLQKELCKEIENVSNIVYAQADFANISNQGTANLLLELAKKFEDKNILFFHFGLAYALYFKKLHKGTTDADKSNNIIDENLGFVADILSTIDGLGILGVIPGAINKIYNASYKKLHLDAEIKDDLKKMELMSVSECEQLLPAFFAYDLNKYLNKSVNDIIVIFLDTYEALWGHKKNEITKFGQDHYIREIISQLQGVLFVISGREYLDWEIIDSDWSNYLNQYKIESLEKSDVNLFLDRCGIKEDNIKNKMIEISMGHPYHLNILVDTYIEMKNRNIIPHVDLFANNAREILACYFRYLQEEEISVIKIISIPRYYNFELFKYLLLNFPTGYSITMFDEFNKFSFVSKMDNGNYHIHEIMRKDLLEIMPNDLFRHVNKSLVEYYISIFINSTSCTEKKLYVRECIYHLKHYMNQNEYVDFLLSNFLNYFVDLQNRGESSYLFDTLSDVFSYIEYSYCVELYEIYTDAIMLNGNFKEAVENIERFLKKYSIEQISSKANILHLYVKKIKHQMVYVSLDETLSLINTIKPFVDTTHFCHQYLELLYTEGNMLFEKGEFKEAQESFDKVLELSEQYNYIDIKCRVLRKKADLCLMTNDVYQAKINCDNGLKIAKDNNLIRYGNYLECTQAEIYRKLKLFEQSKELYINCQKRFTNLGIQPWIAHTELGLAMIDLEQENYSALNNHLNVAEKIYTQYTHTWGLIHTKLIRLLSEFFQKESFTQCLYDELNNKCKKYGYDYIRKMLEGIKHNECVTTNLMFL